MPRVVIPTVADFERVILEEEGGYTVLGAYYANESDAAIQRRRAAERMRSDAERRAKVIASTYLPAH